MFDEAKIITLRNSFKVYGKGKKIPYVRPKWDRCLIVINFSLVGGGRKYGWEGWLTGRKGGRGIDTEKH